MTTLYIEPIHESGEILQLVRSAIESEVAKLELALKMAVKRLAPFEEKYGVTSEYFLAAMTAEDLEGKDADFSVVLFRPNFMLASEEHPMKAHKNQWL
jgi:hypothetical protein